MEKNFLTEKRSIIIAALLAGSFLAQTYFASLHQSVTADELGFISSGYVYLTKSDFRLDPMTPPLMQELEALPLLSMDLNVPPYPSVWLESVNPQVAFGKAFVFGSGNDPLRMIYLARLPVILMGGCMVMGIFLWGRRLFGHGPALVATALAAFSPNLIAHSQLATVDVGCTASMFGALWAYWAAIKKGRTRDWALCGLVTGLALLTKFTALLLGPIYILIAALLLYRREPGVKPATIAKAFIIVGAVSFIVVGAGYNFTFDWTKYISGISAIYSDHIPGRRYYLFGMVSEKPFWYHNLAGLATKEPESTLLLLLIAAAAFAVRRNKGDAPVFLVVPLLIVTVTSFFDTENLGLRRILPAFPFLFLFASYAVCGIRYRPALAGAALLLCWTAYQALAIYPHHLSYFNTLAGGPERGPYLFDDSNVEWGQDLPALAEWQRAHPGYPPVRLIYIGNASPGAYGVRSSSFEDDLKDISQLERPEPGIYAISAHTLVWFRKLKYDRGADIDWLTKYKPIGRAGYSIYIYRIE